MNNLHRELAPISEPLGRKSKRKLRVHLSATLPGGASSTCRGRAVRPLRGRHRPPGNRRPGDGIVARQREVKALVELRVPFELDRQAIDDVERGANDSDWQPAKDAARQIAFAKDSAIFEG